MNYAGFWRRFAAYLVDSILLSAAMYIIAFALMFAFGGGLDVVSASTQNLDSIDGMIGDMEQDQPNFDMEYSPDFSTEYSLDGETEVTRLGGAMLRYMQILSSISLVFVIVGWLYFALMESSAKRATIGKMLLGIVVTDLGGNRISFGRATARFWSKIISGLILYIGFIMAGFTEKKQGLHDIIAGTLVLKK